MTGDLLLNGMATAFGIPLEEILPFVETTVKSRFELKDCTPCLRPYNTTGNTAHVENHDSAFTQTQIVHFENFIDSLSNLNRKPTKCDLLLSKTNSNSTIAFLELSESAAQYALESKYSTAQHQLRAAIELVAERDGQLLSQYGQRLAVYAYRITDDDSHPMQKNAQLWGRATRPNSITSQADFGYGFQFKMVRYPAPIVL